MYLGTGYFDAVTNRKKEGLQKVKYTCNRKINAKINNLLVTLHFCFYFSTTGFRILGIIVVIVGLLNLAYPDHLRV